MIKLFHLEDTKLLANDIAKKVEEGDSIALYGDLGSGKTTLTNYLVQALLGEGEVTSPSFNLVNIYQRDSKEIWHFDLYRINLELELEEIGIYEALGKFTTIIEWPELVEAYLPENHLKIYLRLLDSGEREAKLIGSGHWKGEF